MAGDRPTLPPVWEHPSGKYSGKGGANRLAQPTVRVAGLFLLAFALLPISFEVTGRGAEPDAEGIAFFEKRIRPILVDHCYKCHSKKAEEVEADLYVDSREGLLKGGDQGPAMEPGDPEGSLLFQAVKYELDDLKMPPDKRLDDAQIADLKKWIEMGAPDPRKHGARRAAPREQGGRSTD